MQPVEPDREYLAFASSIPPLRLSSTGRMFRGASAVKRQLAIAEGLVGFSLLAEPLRKRYATLSVWLDEASLDAFTQATPHGQLMTTLKDQMGPTKFVRWTFNGTDGRPTWDAALDRLRSP